MYIKKQSLRTLHRFLEKKVPVERHCRPHVIKSTPSDATDQVAIIASEFGGFVLFINKRRNNRTFTKILPRIVDSNPVDGILNSSCLSERGPRSERAIAGKSGWLQNAVDAVLGIGCQPARQTWVSHVRTD